MSDAVIRVEGIGKRYRVGQRQSYRALRDVLAGAFRRNAKRKPADFIWAVRDVSFEVKQGEVVGLIGRNGAGKSTLLKLLARITRPTVGRAELHGRIGSLLEVGTGFHPELTGRENIFLSGAILGMSKAEILRKYDEIVAFSEVERFIDTPLKHYSSGMGMRLAFAVAAHLEPEILLVDEVLSVGDASFQKKCLGKMQDVSRAGRTILFVSHNMTAVQALCRRVAWLRDGTILQEGPPQSVVYAYLSQSARSPDQNIWPDRKSAPGNDAVRIRKVSIRPDNANTSENYDAEPITVRTPLVMEFEYWNLQPGAYLSLSLHIYTGDDSRAFNTFPASEVGWAGKAFPAGLFRSSCHIPANLLNDGTYRVQLLVVKDQSAVIFNMEDALIFEVRDVRSADINWYDKVLGVVRPNLDWRTDFLEASSPEPALQR
ncbi:MAG: ABC transporter ATP-binding protein [Candidatus Acidiferrales bacterium]